MTDKLNRLFIVSISDAEFINDMKKDEPDEFTMPSAMWTDKQRTIWAATYYGWLIGKGKRKDKHNEKE